MSYISTEEFLRKGHEIDLDFVNQDSVLKAIARRAPQIATTGQMMSWDAVRNEWTHYYDENIKKVPFLPLQDDSDLTTWQNRLADWKKKGQDWAKQSNDAPLKNLVSDMPQSAASAEHQEKIEEAKKGVKTSTWLFLGFGLGGLVSLGYVLSSVARLRGK